MKDGVQLKFKSPSLLTCVKHQALYTFFKNEAAKTKGKENAKGNHKKISFRHKNKHPKCPLPHMI